MCWSQVGPQLESLDFTMGYGMTSCVLHHGYPAERFLPCKLVIEPGKFAANAFKLSEGFRGARRLDAAALPKIYLRAEFALEFEHRLQAFLAQLEVYLFGKMMVDDARARSGRTRSKHKLLFQQNNICQSFGGEMKSDACTRYASAYYDCISRFNHIVTPRLPLYHLARSWYSHHHNRDVGCESKRGRERKA